MSRNTYPILNRIMKEIRQVIIDKTKESKTMLGRWAKPSCLKKEEKIVYYANMDHCGDCGKLKVKSS